MSTGPIDANVSHQLPPSAAGSAMAKAVAPIQASASTGARQLELQAATAGLPNLGPYRMSQGSGFQLVVYSEPLLRTGLQPAIADRGRVFDTRA